MSSVEPILWEKERLTIIDQTRLPEEVKYIEINTVDDALEAIIRLRIRGAPALGIFSAFALVALLKKMKPQNTQKGIEILYQIGNLLKSTRPTAVNLFLGVDTIIRKAEQLKNESLDIFVDEIETEAMQLFEREVESCRKIGEHGNTLIPYNATILTHCNAGALATGRYGTALSPIYTAHLNGKQIKVIADETSPLLQGSRLTAWELKQAGIPVTVICDNMAGLLMKEKKIDMVIVGADRVAKNGDTANKIGTYSLAVLAHYHNVPFFVAAPISTFDNKISTGTDIPIEIRDSSEVQFWNGKPITPKDVNIYNPAFDITPNELITAFITNKGIIYPPFNENLNVCLFS